MVMTEENEKTEEDKNQIQVWTTFSELYQIRRGKKEYGELVGIVLAFLATLWEYLPEVWTPIVCIPQGKIPDGYFLTLLSPLVVVWWIFWGILLCVTEVVVGVLIVVALPYTLLFEIPAEFIRRNGIKNAVE